MTITITPVADCVVCRQQLCHDHRTCSGELSALLTRIDERSARERCERDRP